VEKKIKIGGRYIGDNEPIYLIGEIGINHNGDLQIAKKLIDAAFVTDWDCVKFQKRTPDICIPENQKSILRETPWGEMTYLEYKKRIEFGKTEYDFIDKYCRDKPIHWSVSVWDIQSLEFILHYDIPFIKIPSAMIGNTELFIKCIETQKPLFVSTGMSTIEEIDEAVNRLEKYARGGYVIFHTNSTYPTPEEEINMQMITTLKNRYNCIVGYSGHEEDIQPSTYAPLFGACVIERHITLNHKMWGTDQGSSLELNGMLLLRRRISSLKKIIGDGVKQLSEKEAKTREKLRHEK
jgi:N-acetylneuraminate synthase